MQSFKPMGLTCIATLCLSILCSMSLQAKEAVFDDTLAQNSSARIIGGSSFSEAYPWMVSLQKIYQSSPTELSYHFCGGSLIGKDWVLTAAHCLEDETFESFRMYIGTTESTSVTSGELRTAEWFSIHPDYDSEELSNDIAIIKLSSSSSKTPIPLINNAASLGLTQNEQLRVIGWGLTEDGNFESGPVGLLEVDVSFQADSVCENTYVSTRSIANYWDLALCAGEISGGKDSCQGDSGGPIMVKANGDWALAGVVSWGSGCGVSGSYGVYAQAAHFQKWIDERRTGVTVIGANKIGFLGEGKKKAEPYKVVNLSANNKTISSKNIQQNDRFEIDANNWVIGDSIPASSQCDFTVNALGPVVGEQNRKLQINLTDASFDPVKFSLNSKVLDELDEVVATALDVDWTFYSGTGEATEHATPWSRFTEAGRVNSDVLSSGNVGVHDSRSVLLGYLSGSGGAEPHYLKFEARVSSLISQTTADRLLVFSNQEFQNPNDLLLAGNLNSWNSYGFALTEDINHLLFIYSKDEEGSGGQDRAHLDNFRICTDEADLSRSINDEVSCTAVVGFNNTEDLGAQDDLVAGETSADVCSEITYSDSAINHVSRSESDRRFVGGNNPNTPDNPDTVLTRKGSSGALSAHWLVLFSLMFFVRLRRKSV